MGFYGFLIEFLLVFMGFYGFWGKTHKNLTFFMGFQFYGFYGFCGFYEIPTGPFQSSHSSTQQNCAEFATSYHFGGRERKRSKFLLIICEQSSVRKAFD